MNAHREKILVTISNVLFGTAIVAVVWGIVSSIRIVSYLLNKGEKINFFLIRLLIIKYVSQYRQMTAEETGQPGFWYYSYIGSMLTALVTAILGFIIR